jgi:hypothetical protein
MSGRTFGFRLTAASPRYPLLCGSTSHSGVGNHKYGGGIRRAIANACFTFIYVLQKVFQRLICWAVSRAELRSIFVL